LSAEIRSQNNTRKLADNKTIRRFKMEQQLILKPHARHLGKNRSYECQTPHKLGQNLWIANTFNRRQHCLAYMHLIWGQLHVVPAERLPVPGVSDRT